MPDGECEELTEAFRMLSFENPAGKPPEAPRMAQPKKRKAACGKQSSEPAPEASEAPKEPAPPPRRRGNRRTGLQRAARARGRGRGRGRGGKVRGRGRGRGRGRRAPVRKSESSGSEESSDASSSSEAESGEEESAEPSASAPSVRRSKRKAAQGVTYREESEVSSEPSDMDLVDE